MFGFRVKANTRYLGLRKYIIYCTVTWALGAFGYTIVNGTHQPWHWKIVATARARILSLG